MNAKLTLTMEQSVIDTAKRYAKLKERSLSDLIENYLRMITKEATPGDVTLTPIVKMLKGSFHAPSDFDYKKELIDELTDKYMK